MNIDLTFSYNTWLLVLGALLFAVVSWWVYKYTTPAVAELLRKLLLWLRFVSIAAVLFLIFEPVLGLSWRLVEKPVIALLIDTSSSMQLGKADSTRAQQMRDLLAKPWRRKLADKYQLAPFAFADRATALEDADLDSLTFDGDGSDLRAAIDFASENLAGKNLAAMLLLSDGVQNIGADPIAGALAAGVPVHTVGIGSDTPVKDTLLAEILTNEIG